MEKISLLLFDRITNIFYKKLSTIDINSKINCSIEFKNANLHLSNNCNVNVINKCISNESISFRLLLESIQEALPMMSEKDRRIIHERLGINENTDIGKAIDDKNDNPGVVPTIVEKCNAYAGVDNRIYINDIEILSCEASVPMYFKFINTGSATANCGLSELSKTLVELNNSKEKEKEKKITRLFGIKIDDYIYRLFPLILVFVILYILTICILYLFKRYTVICYSRNDLLSREVSRYSVFLSDIRPPILSYIK